MATGDNALTAISVARECGIIDPETEVFFGETKGDRVVWKSTGRGEHALNKTTLAPDPRTYTKYENKERFDEE